MSRTVPRRGRPTNEEIVARRTGNITPNGDGCDWTRPDGRVLSMPWTIDELWARLCREVALESNHADESNWKRAARLLGEGISAAIDLLDADAPCPVVTDGGIEVVRRDNQDCSCYPCRAARVLRNARAEVFGAYEGDPDAMLRDGAPEGSAR